MGLSEVDRQFIEYLQPELEENYQFFLRQMGAYVAPSDRDYVYELAFYNNVTVDESSLLEKGYWVFWFKNMVCLVDQDTQRFYPPGTKDVNDRVFCSILFEWDNKDGLPEFLHSREISERATEADYPKKPIDDLAKRWAGIAFVAHRLRTILTDKWKSPRYPVSGPELYEENMNFWVLDNPYATDDRRRRFPYLDDSALYV